MEAAWKQSLVLMLLFWFLPFSQHSCLYCHWSQNREQLYFPYSIFSQVSVLVVTTQMTSRGWGLGEGAGDCLSHHGHPKSSV